MKVQEEAVAQCVHCGESIFTEDKALFVEEELGRVFCTEGCITEHFKPEIKEVEKFYLKNRPKDDLSAAEREKNLHLRWTTLQEPDEVWVQKKESGDFWFTLISEFNLGDEPVWCVCVCLCLYGDPSFLFLAFPTRSEKLVDKFRKGDRIQWGMPKNLWSEDTRTDGLDTHWSPFVPDTDDIPRNEYAKYDELFQKVLDEPDEVWVKSLEEDQQQTDTYHFIRQFENLWYLIIAREIHGGDELEVLDQVVSSKAAAVNKFRVGKLESGKVSPDSAIRLLH